MVPVRRKRRERGGRSRTARLRGVEGLRERLEPPRVVPVPAPHGIGRPLRAALLVTAVAGVRHAERRGEIGARDAQGVIAARIDHHVARRGHVTAHAPRRVRRRGVEVVLPAVVPRRRVTPGAERIAVGTQLLGVRIVAIAAGHAAPVHPALEERAPDVHLVALLAVGVVEARREERREVVIEERLPGAVALRDLRAPGVAGRARLDLAVLLPRPATGDGAGRRVDPPGHPATLVEGDRPSLLRVGASRRARPGDVRRAWPVARLASDRQLGPGGRVPVARGIVALADARRMAIRAHVVPVLRAPRPVELVAVVDLLGGIEVKPPLAALRRRARVPGDGERLEASAGELDEVLLQRLEAERVLHLELCELPVGAVRPDEEPAVPLEEGRPDARVDEARPPEVATHRRRARRLHGAGVLRALPGDVLRTMTLRASLAAHELGRGERRRTGRRVGGRGAALAVQHDRRGEDQRHGEGGQDPGASRSRMFRSRRGARDRGA